MPEIPPVSSQITSFFWNSDECFNFFKMSCGTFTVTDHPALQERLDPCRCVRKREDCE